MPEEKKHNLKMENGKIDITNIDFAKGDKLVINGIEQLVIDICEADVLTESNGKEIGYEIVIDADKTYLEVGK